MVCICTMFKMCRGPITDVHVDGLWSKNGYTGVRLLSAGSPIKRIKLANIYGTYLQKVDPVTGDLLLDSTGTKLLDERAFQIFRKDEACLRINW